MTHLLRLLLIAILTISTEANAKRSTVKALIKRQALAVGVPPQLLIAICSVESGLNPYVTNFHDGGRHSHGLCQVQTRTARWLGCARNAEQLYKPAINAKCAAEYLRYQLKRYKGYEPYAVAAYNTGTLKRTKTGRIVNQDYVDKVYKRLK